MSRIKKRRYNAEGTQVASYQDREVFADVAASRSRAQSASDRNRNVKRSRTQDDAGAPPSLSKNTSHGEGSQILGRWNGPRPSPRQPARNRNSSQLRSAPPRIVQGSRRRRGDASSGSRMPKQPRTVEGGPFMDGDYLRANFELPERAQYRRAPPALFKDGARYSTIFNGMNRQGLGFNRDIKSVYHQSAGSSFRCTIEAESPDGSTIEAIGDGTTKKTCQHAAAIHLVAQLHQSGALKDIFAATESLTKQTLREEKDSILDVYNYGAKYGYLPLVKMETGTRGARRARVRITLSEHGIDVDAIASSVQPALVSACIKFKLQAETLQAEGTYADATQTGISSGSVGNFLDFYKLQNPHTQFDVRIEPSRMKWFGGGGIEAQATMNGDPVGPNMDASNKKSAEALSQLVMAVTLAQQDPSLIEEFNNTAKSSKGEILGPVRPIDADFSRDMLRSMERTLAELRSHETSSQNHDDLDPVDKAGVRKMRERFHLSQEDMEIRSRALKERQAQFARNPAAAKMIEIRETLPMNQFKQQVLDHINNHAYSVVVGATGSGKTTQVPQILLEDAIANGKGGAYDIICTQPRRIAATSVAKRVADERLERLQEAVGYQVRFDAKLPRPGGSITYCTTGILLQQIQHAPDELFDTVSALIIDEVHERDILIDFLLNLIRRTAEVRRRAGKRVPKIVLMSATIDSELFAEYFETPASDGSVSKCPSLSIPGRTFPVRDRYFAEILEDLQKTPGSSIMRMLGSDKDTKEYMELEGRFMSSNPDAVVPNQPINWKRDRTAKASTEDNGEMEDALVPINLVAATVGHIAKTTDQGAMLVFLPGYDEMKKTRLALEDQSPFGINFKDTTKFRLSMLHSSVPANEQAEVFNEVPEGCRKVILSTNIAETSVTIPDVQYVIDTGKLREKRYDQIRRITKLQCTWISKSNAKQRAGRAGRVQNGNYYALYSKARFESLRSIGLPEMLRSDLQEICLDVKAHDFGSSIRNFLSDSIEPPPPAAVRSSIENLQSLQALTEDEDLTALGRLLASLPVHPSLGKMIVLGVIFRCLDPMIILGAALNERPIFVSPPEERVRARQQQEPFAENTKSDHIALINAMRHTRLIEGQRGFSAARDFCFERFIHYGAYKVIKQTAEQIEDVLVDAGLIPRTDASERYAGEIGPSALNQNATNVHVTTALALAGLQPNMAFSQGSTLRAATENHTMIHPSSFNAPPRDRRHQEETRQRGTLFTFSTMQKSNDGNSMFLRETSVISPLMALLFGGRHDSEGRVMKIDNWLPLFIQADWRDRRTILAFRNLMDSLLSSAFDSLARLKKENPKFAKLPRTKRMEQTYLADDKELETFASGLVDVLDLSAYPKSSDMGFGKTDSYRTDSNKRDSYRPDRAQKESFDMDIDMGSFDDERKEPASLVGMARSNRAATRADNPRGVISRYAS